MAKVSFTKLKLSKQEKVEIVKINDVDIEVKQYLPINDKIGIIENVLKNSADDNNFANPIKLEVFLYLEIIYNYTNINFTEVQKKDPVKLYDLLEENHVFTDIIAAIPENEFNYLVDSTDETIKAFYDYQNSIMGILERVSTDYKDLNLDASEIQKKLADGENIELLKDILEKLG